jgi:hypothetical protein
MTGQLAFFGDGHGHLTEEEQAARQRVIAERLRQLDARYPPARDDDDDWPDNPEEARR